MADKTVAEELVKLREAAERAETVLRKYPMAIVGSWYEYKWFVPFGSIKNRLAVVEKNNFGGFTVLFKDPAIDVVELTPNGRANWEASELMYFFSSRFDGFWERLIDISIPSSDMLAGLSPAIPSSGDATPELVVPLREQFEAAALLFMRKFAQSEHKECLDAAIRASDAALRIPIVQRFEEVALGDMRRQ